MAQNGPKRPQRPTTQGTIPTMLGTTPTMLGTIPTMLGTTRSGPDPPSESGEGNRGADLELELRVWRATGITGISRSAMSGNPEGASGGRMWVLPH